MIKISIANQLSAFIVSHILRSLEKAEDGIHYSKLYGTLSKKIAAKEMPEEVTKYATLLLPSGVERWRNFFFYNSVALVKAGFIIKNKGYWYITASGRANANKKPIELLDATITLYRKWVIGKDIDEIAETEDIPPLENIRSEADDDISRYIQNLSPYKFQEVVAALFRGMGYYTPFVAPEGKDGGVDIIALSDPLGAKPPTIKIQVKHYNEKNAISVEVVRSILGVTNGSVPIVITSGRFTNAAKTEARLFNVRLIDGVEFISLWIKFYDAMSEDDKLLMPIEPIYFIKRNN